MTFLAFRRGSTDDLNFIMSSWLRSYRHSNLAKEQTTDAYYRVHNKVILKNMHKFEVLVACNNEVSSEIYGYIVYSKTVADILLIHYVYVKNEYRHNDIASQLLSLAIDDSKDIIVTHNTAQGEYFMKSTGLKYYYSPSLFYIPELFE